MKQPLAVLAPHKAKRRKARTEMKCFAQVTLISNFKRKRRRKMKKMKKLFAVLLTLAMVLGMSLTAFAEAGDDTTDPPQTGSPKATIIGVEQEEGKTIAVTAYQIIKYNDAGFYEEVIKSSIDISSTSTDGSMPQLTPTSAYIEDLYYNHMTELKALPNTQKVTFTKQADGTYTYDELGLGTWLVVVEGCEKYMYNPAIISVNKTSTGVEYGELNLNTETWNKTEETYLKKDEPTITKKAETVEGSGADQEVIGTQFGDILKFTVTADIPAYTKDKENITYKISDTLTGLTIVKNNEYPINVEVGGKSLKTSKDELDKTAYNVFDTAIQNNANNFVVTGLTDEFLIAHSNQKITVEYYAKVTSTVMINVDKLNNKASLEYSNNSTTDSNTTTKETETKHYTFGIDTFIKGVTGGEEGTKTGEFIKINDKGDIEYTEKLGEIQKKDDEVVFLDGAKFKLFIGMPTRNATTKKYEGTVFSDKSGKDEFTTSRDGRLQIVGLDDGVDYYLVETEAPAGYTLNDTPVKVRIDATYKLDSETNLTDILESYTVTIGEGDQAANTYYGYNYEEGETTLNLKNSEDKPSNPFGFKNTKLTNLPSTGGIGTTIFTVVGCLIMIAAAGMFFVSRRKAAK